MVPLGSPAIAVDLLVEEMTRARDTYRELLSLTLTQLHDAHRRIERLDAERLVLRERLRAARSSSGRAA